MIIGRLVPFMKWYIDSFKRVIFSPNAFFADESVRKNATRASWFAAISLAVGVGGQAVVELLMAQSTYLLLANDSNSLSDVASLLGQSGPGFEQAFLSQLQVFRTEKVVVLALLPFISFFTLHLFAGLLHLVLRGIGPGGNENVKYEHLLATVAYAFAPFVFSPIPLLGPLVASAWAFYLVLIGVKQLYSLGPFTRLILVFFPAVALRSLWAFALSTLAFAASPPDNHQNHDAGQNMASLDPQSVKKLK